MTQKRVRRVAIVTGGLGGIGSAIVSRLEAEGLAVASIDLVERPPRHGTDETLVRSYHRADLSAYGATATVIDEIVRSRGRVDVLINNAGWDRIQAFGETEPALWERLIDANLRTVLNVTHRVLPVMIAGGGGRIVCVASDAGLVGAVDQAVYSAGKGAVIAFAKALAREVARHNVTVNCVCPGPTDSPLLEELRATDRGDRLMAGVVHATPMRRAAHPSEIANAVSFFVSESSGFVTGQTVSVSGGLTM